MEQTPKKSSVKHIPRSSALDSACHVLFHHSHLLSESLLIQGTWPCPVWQGGKNLVKELNFENVFLLSINTQVTTKQKLVNNKKFMGHTLWFSKHRSMTSSLWLLSSILAFETQHHVVTSILGVKPTLWCTANIVFQEKRGLIFNFKTKIHLLKFLKWVYLHIPYLMSFLLYQYLSTNWLCTLQLIKNQIQGNVVNSPSITSTVITAKILNCWKI